MFNMGRVRGHGAFVCAVGLGAKGSMALVGSAANRARCWELGRERLSASTRVITPCHTANFLIALSGTVASRGPYDQVSPVSAGVGDDALDFGHFHQNSIVFHTNTPQVSGRPGRRPRPGSNRCRCRQCRGVGGDDSGSNRRCRQCRQGVGRRSTRGGVTAAGVAMSAGAVATPDPGRCPGCRRRRCRLAHLQNEGVEGVDRCRIDTQTLGSRRVSGVGGV